MVEPVYSTKTERVYARLPDAVRRDDADAGWGLKLLLSLIADRTSSVSDLVRRFTYLPGVDVATTELRALLGAGLGASSDLVDPARADAGWLAWLAQIPGVTLPPGLSVAAQRLAISGAVNGWLAGTAGSIADAARAVLTGGRYVQVLSHTINEPGDGGRWDVVVVTRISETPDPAKVIPAVQAAHAVPAGVILRRRRYAATFVQTRAALGADTLAGRLARFGTFFDATDYLP